MEERLILNTHSPERRRSRIDCSTTCKVYSAQHLLKVIAPGAICFVQSVLEQSHGVFCLQQSDSDCAVELCSVCSHFGCVGGVCERPVTFVRLSSPRFDTDH